MQAFRTMAAAAVVEGFAIGACRFGPFAGRAVNLAFEEVAGGKLGLARLRVARNLERSVTLSALKQHSDQALLSLAGIGRNAERPMQCLLGRLVLFFGLGAEFDPLFAF